MMQFKNPEILYLFFLLIIPILIHLFQLQKFERVAFTNVKLLKQIEQQSRKSSKLKKLLILISRLLLLASLILAFAQPYLSRNQNQTEPETIVYLDNSFSMQAKGAHGELLEKAKHDLIENFKGYQGDISLITNDQIYKNLQPSDLKNELLKIDYHPVKKNLETVFLQINNLKSKNSNTQTNVILISDFQLINADFSTIEMDSTNRYSVVQSLPAKTENLFIDSLWIDNHNSESITVKSRIVSHESDYDNLSVSLFLDDQLYGKSNKSLNKNQRIDLEFTFPTTYPISGILRFNDNLLQSDNDFYFVIPENNIRKVLALGSDQEFLNRIYTDDEFEFTILNSANFDHQLIQDQELIILNGLQSIPNSLIALIKSHLDRERNLVIIPSIDLDIDSYNNFLSQLGIGQIQDLIRQKSLITTISYSHPFFKNVFQKEIDNFQYPSVNAHFPSSFHQSSSLLSFEDSSDFITEINFSNAKIYWIAAPIDSNNSNFISSPLVVPMFYNFCNPAERQRILYHILGRKNEIMVETIGAKEEMAHISNEDSDFIPLQSKTLNGIKIHLEMLPVSDGFYQINLGDSIKKVAFNYDRKEGNLDSFDIKSMWGKFDNVSIYSTVKDAISNSNDPYKNRNLWQLFIIFALIFLGIEILLQKFMKLDHRSIVNN